MKIGWQKYMEIVLQWKDVQNGFKVKMQWKWVYCKEALKINLL